jgi:hypothetical protein
MSVIVVPMGPIVRHGCEHLVDPIVDSALKHARKKGAFLLQLRVPQTSQAAWETLPGDVELPNSYWHARGSALDLAVAPNGLLRLEFPEDLGPAAWQEALLSRFSPRTRRDVRKSLRSGLWIREATDARLLEEAYAVIVKNSVEHGYTSRTWKQFGSTLIAQVANGQATVLMAYHDDELLGVHYGMIAGRRYTYIMGGTVRTSPDRNVGHFLQWSAMLKAHALGLRGYDFTPGGPPSVQFFKTGFQAERLEFHPPHYYVLCQWRFSLFRRLWPFMKRNRGEVARLLEALRRRTLL